MPAEQLLHARGERQIQQMRKFICSIIWGAERKTAPRKEHCSTCASPAHKKLHTQGSESVVRNSSEICFRVFSFPRVAFFVQKAFLNQCKCVRPEQRSSFAFSSKIIRPCSLADVEVCSFGRFDNWRVHPVRHQADQQTRKSSEMSGRLRAWRNESLR